MATQGHACQGPNCSPFSPLGLVRDPQAHRKWAKSRPPGGGPLFWILSGGWQLLGMGLWLLLALALLLPGRVRDKASRWARWPGRPLNKARVSRGSPATRKEASKPIRVLCFCGDLFFWGGVKEN